ncbi:MAG: hypothetical protein HZA10_03425 [Nitrospirae bacterium]|nr:hypothetical protein [Nitrospirota bacterium]
MTNLIHFDDKSFSGLLSSLRSNVRGSLSENESMMLESEPPAAAVKPKQRVSEGGISKSPIDFSSAGSAGGFPTVSLDSVAPQAGKNILSLIVIQDKIKMAIIKGALVKEGDRIDGMKVAKIEHDKVLLTKRGDKKGEIQEQWLYMEKIK